MGPTWPNLGPRCAPDSFTLLNIGPTKANIGAPCSPQTQVAGARLLGVSLQIRAPATGPCPCRRPSVGNRRLYTLAAPAADPFVGPRGDPVSTPCRPRVDRYICIWRRLFKKCSKTSFFTVFRGLRRTRLWPNRAPVASVMRAQTGLIDISWVLGAEVA